MLNPAITVKPMDFHWGDLGMAPGTPADYQLAKVLYQKELREARLVKDYHGITRLMGSLGYVLLRLKQFKEASRSAAESLKRAETHPDYAAMGYANNLLGDIAYAQGLMEDADLFYHRGWDAYAKIGDKKGEAWSYTHMGHAARSMGHFDRAVRMYDKSAGLIESTVEIQAAAWNKNGMGMLQGWMGRYSKAFSFYQEALELYRLHSDISGQAWTLELMGNLKLAREEDQEAEKIFRQVRVLFSDRGSHPENAAWHHYHIGTVYLFRKNIEDAKDEFVKASGLFNDLNDDLGQAATLVNLGEIACVQQKYLEARDYLKRGMQLALNGSARILLPDMMAGVIPWFQGQGEEKKAISFLMMVLSHSTSCRQTKDRALFLAAPLETDFTNDETDKRLRWMKDTNLEKIAENWLVSLEGGAAPSKKNKKVLSKTQGKKPTF